MYLQIKTLELVPDQYGKHIKITKIGLYENDWKFIKWVKLDSAITIAMLKQYKITYNDNN